MKPNRWMITEAGLSALGDIRRDDIEDYKVWLAAQPRGGGQTITAETHRQRMRTVRQFSERIIEWDWPGAPARNPVIAWDIPKKPEPLPRFPDDRDAAKLMVAARASTDPRDRLVVEPGLVARSRSTPASLAAAQAATNPSSRPRVSSALSCAVASAMSSSPTASATTDRLNRFPASAGVRQEPGPSATRPGSRATVIPAP